MPRIDLVVGVSAFVASLGATTVLVLICRNRIDRISRMGQPTLGEILRELHGR